jgi:hypothetical protein
MLTRLRIAVPNFYRFSPTGAVAPGQLQHVDVDGRVDPLSVHVPLIVIAVDVELIVWGDGEQTRSFLYIDECLEGTLRYCWSTNRAN